ncbi:MAG: hypothetical protein K6F93_06320 [Lachnospiraceae bacterium]|nr:hypothetical protein [Lachnospiraceae bacterium]
MINRNRIEISVKGLILAVVVIIALILSAIALYMVTKAKGTINDGNTQYSELMSDYSEISATLYDGLYVSGEKVRDVIDKMTRSDVISVTVSTKLNQKGTTPGGTTYAGADHEASSYDMTSLTKRIQGSRTSPYDAKEYSPADDNYINPSATFVGKVYKNQNGMVVNITFSQQ